MMELIFTKLFVFGSAASYLLGDEIYYDKAHNVKDSCTPPKNGGA